jgi:hypothetical protein
MTGAPRNEKSRCAFSLANLESSAATSYERGDKQNANFKSSHDHGRFGWRLKLGRLREEGIDGDHYDVSRHHAQLLEIKFHLRMVFMGRPGRSAAWPSFFCGQFLLPAGEG